MTPGEKESYKQERATTKKAAFVDMETSNFQFKSHLVPSSWNATGEQFSKLSLSEKCYKTAGQALCWSFRYSAEQKGQASLDITPKEGLSILARHETSGISCWVYIESPIFVKAPRRGGTNLFQTTKNMHD